MSQSQPVPSDEIQRPDDSSNQGATVARGAVFKFASAYWRVAAVVLLAGVLPWVAAMVARSILRGTYVHELLHECMELAGTCIALAVATLLWLRSQYEKEAPHLMWAAAALVAMGLIDGAHGVVPFGLAWSWLRHSATLVGGLLFAMVWVARPRLEVRRKKFFLSAVAVLSLALALFIGWKPGLFPAPWRAGDYTFAVKAANGLGGLGFLMASMFFLRRYLRQTQTEDIVLASQTMLFGVAGLMFGYSHVWHSGWWVWHGARLAAYGIVLMTAYEVMERAEEEVRVLSETVKEERQRLHDVLNLLPAYVVLLSKDYHVLFANRYFEEQFGKAEGRRCYEYLFQRSQPCENCETYKVLKTNAPHGWEWTGPNGRDYDIHDFPFIDSDGATLILEMGIDITERKAAEERLRYLNRSLRALSDCNQLLLHSPDEPTLLDGVCRILVEHCGHALAWVGYPEQDEAKSVRVAGAAGVAKDYLTPGLVSWADEERGRGPTGTAIRTGKAVTLEDASTDPRFGPWREQALSRGFHSSVCLPVLIGETVPAGLTIYSTQRGAFQGEELKLLEELAQDLGYGIRMLRMRAERERTQERMSYLAGIVESSEDAIYSKDLEGTILSWNHGAEKIFGYTAEDIVGQRVSRLATPETQEELGRILESIRSGETVEHYETVRVRKDGTRRDVSVTVSPIRDAQGRITGASSIARDITDRKRAERRLQEQQFYTRSLIEASLDPLVTISRDGKITDVNRATETVTGASREGLIGSDFCDYFSEPEQARAGYQQVFADGFVQDYPLAIRHTSGRLTEVLYNATVFRSQKGEVQGVFAAARDITDRKRAEEQVRKASVYTRSLIEASLDPLVTISREGKITDVNRATETVTGIARERLIGSDFCDYFSEPEQARAGYQQVFADGFVQDYPLAIRHTSGRLTEVLYNATVFRNQKGEVQGVFAAARDITQRKRAEELLEQERQRFRDVLDNLPVMVCLLTPDHHVSFANNTFQKQFGEAKGRHCYEYCFGRNAPCDFCEAYQVLQTGLPHDWEVATPDQRHLQVFNFPFSDTDGSPLILEMDVDVTEQRQAEQQLKHYAAELERSNAELQDFTSIASHDLQEPLRKVLAFGEHLREHLGDNLDELGSDFLARMQNAAQRMSGLIQALLDYSRVTTRAQPFQSVDMTQLLFQVLLDMEDRIAKSHARVAFLPLPEVMADPTQVRQLLQNLLANALKFQPAGRTPQVELKAQSKNGWCEISVADNGIGFEEKYMDRIFRPFQRLHGRNEYEGSGMGLAICRKVVARHGGEITAHSRPGEGSTFVVTLPTTASRNAGEETWQIDTQAS